MLNANALAHPHPPVRQVSLQEYLAGISEDGEEDLSLENVTEDADFEDWLGTIKVGVLLPYLYF